MKWTDIPIQEGTIYVTYRTRYRPAHDEHMLIHMEPYFDHLMLETPDGDVPFNGILKGLRDLDWHYDLTGYELLIATADSVDRLCSCSIAELMQGGCTCGGK